MKVFTVVRTRLVTERYRVLALTEEAAYKAIETGAGGVEKLEESTVTSISCTDNVEGDQQ